MTVVPGNEVIEQPDTSKITYPGPDNTAIRSTAEARPRVCLFILGMHRSGTSSLAGTLAKLGVTPPAHLLGAHEGNPSGHWESQPLMAFHDELLASAGSRWDDWREFNSAWYETPVCAKFKARGKQLLDEEFGDAPLFVFKDPRNCRIARFWFDVFAEQGIEARIVLPIRSPLEVAHSHRARDDFPLRKGLLLWLRHVLDAEVASRECSRIIIEWDVFLKDWQGAVSAMEGVLGCLPAVTDLAAAEVDRFLCRDLKRQRVGKDELARSALVHAWVEETYVAMCELARNPGSNSARIVLDQVRSHFDDASRLFGGVLADTEVWVSDLQQNYAAAVRNAEEAMAQRDAHATEAMRLAQAHAEVDRGRSEALAQLSAMMHERDAQAAETARLARAQADADGEREEALRQLSALKEELTVILSDSAERSAEVSRLAGALSELERRHEDTTLAREKLQEDLAKTNADLGELDLRRLAVEAERDTTLTENRDLRADVQRLVEEAAEGRQRRVELQEAMKSYEMQIEQIKRSRSWRLTSKLAKIRSMFR